ncbi:MAG TPA: sulfur carrier protein ThiS [Stellaceae bacterium]|jgi:sulfur carrier protein|nr:sulfur carrier protein ThiS [Stellaceae bacterium]
MTRIRVNGQEEDVIVTTISELLATRGVDPTARFLAVAVNGSVVRRSEWSTKSLGPGDNIEIVRPFSGG